ncbi:MAG: protein-disulfide reductase DsbD [Burkholderiaceae bacterium]
MPEQSQQFLFEPSARCLGARVQHRFIQCARFVTQFALMTSLLVSASLSTAQDFLAPEQAFAFSARMRDASTIELSFRIADGYYMYRDKISLTADGATLGKFDLPRGKIKFDPNFDKELETFRHQLSLTIPVQASGPFRLKVTSQGCADKGLCYPPMDSVVQLSPNAINNSGVNAQASNGAGNTTTAGTTLIGKNNNDGSANERIGDETTHGSFGSSSPIANQMTQIQASLASGRLLLILPLFFLLGLGLSFTPCVLPMVPILSFIIAGEGAASSRRRGFLLALAYSLGMAIVYTALGVAAGLIGEGLSAALQSPLLLTTFAILMAVMALSMFDLYQLQVPTSLQLALTRLSERQRGGKFIGVFVMGAISALIVGPCVAAPLAGALVYISQTRDVVIGGSALFAMAAGMSMPLLLVGASAGSLLPKAGAWMQTVKIFFGVLMLALAVWMVSSLIPAWLLMVVWGLLAVGYGASLLRVKTLGWLARLLGLLFVVLGSAQWLGAATGARDPWSPLAHWRGQAHQATAFSRVRNNAELDQVLANTSGRRVMLDFYADWCVSCIEMEKLTFTDPAVKAKLDQMLLLQVDVTANAAEDKALLKRFGLFGPPGILFFDETGREIASARVIGFQAASDFLRSIEHVEQVAK